MDEEERLVQEIENAFSDTSYPSDNTIVPLYNNEPHCAECAELAETFRDKTWKSVPIKTLAGWRGSLSLFTNEAFQYYLPAFLQAALLHTAETDTLWENIFYILTPPEENTGSKMERFLQRISGFTNKQKDVLKRYMRLYLEIETSYEVHGKTRVIEFWKLNDL